MALTECPGLGGGRCALSALEAPGLPLMKGGRVLRMSPLGGRRCRSLTSTECPWDWTGPTTLDALCVVRPFHSREVLPLPVPAASLSLVHFPGNRLRSVCEVTDSVPGINSCEGEGGRAGQREELVPLTPGGLVPCSGRPLVWAAPWPVQPWPSPFLDSFDCECPGPCVTCGSACLHARDSPG